MNASIFSGARWPILIAFSFLGCGRDEFSSAGKMEKLGRYPTAIETYETFLQKNPQHARTPETLFRMGEIYRKVLKDYGRARAAYDKIIESYKDSPWFAPAQKGYMNSPDYFPLAANMERVLGDSQSGGKHMKIKEVLKPVENNADRFQMSRKIYAGDTAVDTVELVYEKKENELREYPSDGSGYVVFLRYPPVKGMEWKTTVNKEKMVFTVEDDRSAVKTAAGSFPDCVKVKQRPEKSKTTWKYNYFAPDAGLVLTAIATENSETNVVELLSYGKVE